MRSSTFTERYNSFFVDYDLIPLLVQQAMPQSVQTPRGEAPTSKLARMADAADAIALSDVMSNCVRMRGQWSLLTSVAAMNVKAAYHASGSVAFPGFPEWFGKNSTMGKRRRLLGELSMHLNHRVSGGSQSLRMHYMETLKSAFYAPMLEKVCPAAVPSCRQCVSTLAACARRVPTVFRTPSQCLTRTGCPSKT